MGSPLYITTPVIAQAIVPTLTGAALDPIADATPLVTAAGATLIESIEWAIDQATLDDSSVDEGQIAIVLDDGINRNVLTYVKSASWPLGDSGFHGSFDLALALPNGWSIYVSHNLTIFAIGFDLTFTARGGLIG